VSRSKKSQGVDACCPELNKTLNLALDVEGCRVDLGGMLELVRDQPLPQIYLKYNLHLLQDLDSNKLTLSGLDKSIKEQIVNKIAQIIFYNVDCLILLSKALL